MASGSTRNSVSTFSLSAGWGGGSSAGSSCSRIRFQPSPPTPTPSSKNGTVGSPGTRASEMRTPEAISRG